MSAEGFDYFSWVIMPLIIFGARICDVTFGTLRHVFIAKGFKNLAPIFGFFEVLIWILVIKEIIISANNWACYLGWAFGFATGNYLGLRIEERLALGLQIIRIITNQDCSHLIEILKNENHGITVVEGQGAKGPVKMIFTIAKRKNIQHIEELIELYTPGAFYSVEDVKNSSHGVFNKHNKQLLFYRKLFPERKGL